MPIKLTAADWRAIFPRAPQEVINAFAAKQAVLDKAGITATKTRLAYFLANIEHECGGFTIKNLTENIGYTAARMAQVWPNRFKSAAAVQAKYGTGKGWQIKAFDDIYGNRMGNRPGTADGSTYIGRGGPQWTGRDGYAALQRITGLSTVAQPELASRLDMQPEICAAFWTWKNLNRFADANDFLGCVKAWNGGTNGLADRKALMAGNDPIIKRLENVATVGGVVADKPTQPLPPFLEPGAKPPAKPPEPASGAVKGGVATGAVVVAGGAAAVQQGVSALEVAAWIGGLTGIAIIIFIIGYRIVKGAWPWKSTSTGAGSPVSSPLSLPSSGPSLALHSAASQDQLALASAALSAASQATPLPTPLASKRPRKQSAKPSPKTPTRARKSSKSKPSAVKKSSSKPKSKSKG